MNYKERLVQADNENKREKQIVQAYARAKRNWEADIQETQFALEEAKDKLEVARLKEPLLSQEVLAAKREVNSYETGLKELNEEFKILFQETSLTTSNEPQNGDLMGAQG